MAGENSLPENRSSRGKAPASSGLLLNATPASRKQGRHEKPTDNLEIGLSGRKAAVANRAVSYTRLPTHPRKQLAG